MTTQTQTVITFGTYDLFHYGHLRLLQRAKQLGGKLVVGVSSDELNMKKKGRYPVYNQEHRMAIVSELECVDRVFIEDSLELKKKYIEDAKADVLVMGDDWEGQFDSMAKKTIYLKRTSGISTTQIIINIKDAF